MIEAHGLCRFWASAFLSSHKALFAVLWVAAFGSVFLWQRNVPGGSLFGWRGVGVAPPVAARPFPRLRGTAFNLTDFGAVGDGVTLNTEAFERAMIAIGKLGRAGGGQLNGAVILGIEDQKYWPLMPPLPSYGYGREHRGPRYGSLLHGQNLRDVVITGHNGTINGQGQIWWKRYRQKLLNHTRGPLIQIMWSSDINVTVKNVTILNPIFQAPNTDGIDPDSCEDMVIEDCYISVGDDAIAIKSGWDQYGIAYGRPSKNILIRNLVVRSMVR
ncbi:hypothetical protein CRG98_044621 [Punica granatum]|uniref:Polygalacturonase n=1 Tax=Punica granatum TaxID=22663 RepID=A0A2I0HU33_PUNGR|nr:hypothetical protein CRG98_044621 [Punica granatum]